ncbi:MAG: methylmalonyl-CoA mutase family protein, partial [Ginsengibacter sp.]
SAYHYQKDIESGDKIIVGVNAFQHDTESRPGTFSVDDSIRQVQIDKINQIKSKRDAIKVAECLADIKRRAIENENLMPAVIEAVESYCTLGEISDELRGVFGEYK